MTPRDDLPFCILSANAYHPAPEPGIQRVTFQDISADIAGDTCAIRGTNSFATLVRDFNVEGWLDYTHPTLGPMQSGAFLAAQGLLPLLPAGLRTFTGHSEAGGIAPILGALYGGSQMVTWDGVKPGGAGIKAWWQGKAARSYAFKGSPVSGWPFLLDDHIVPVVWICDWTINLAKAHSIDRAQTWLASQQIP